MQMELDVVPRPHRRPELLPDTGVVEEVATRLLEVPPEAKDLRHIGHHGEPGAVPIELRQHALGRLHHEIAGRAVTVAVDLVIEGEDDSKPHAVPLVRSAVSNGRSQRLYIAESHGYTLDSAGSTLEYRTGVASIAARPDSNSHRGGGESACRR